jgi:hypothetical protein
MLPAVGAGEVDELASGEGGSGTFTRLGIEELPVRIADRRD